MASTTDHYGRHDRKALGHKAIPMSLIIGNLDCDSEVRANYYLNSYYGSPGGRHRAGPPCNGSVRWHDDEFGTGWFAITSSGPYRHVVAGAADAP